MSAALRRVGKISELTDILHSWCQHCIAQCAQYDPPNQNRSPLDTWELIRLDEGGPQLADLEVKVRSSEADIPQVWTKENPQRWRPLLPDARNNVGQMAGSQAHWPYSQRHSRHSRDILAGLRRTDDLFTTCVAEGEVSEIFWYHFSPTLRLAVVWPGVNHSAWVHVKLIHLKASSSLFRLWCWPRKIKILRVLRHYFQGQAMHCDPELRPCESSVLELFFILFVLIQQGFQILFSETFAYN